MQLFKADKQCSYCLDPEIRVGIVNSINQSVQISADGDIKSGACSITSAGLDIVTDSLLFTQELCANFQAVRQISIKENALARDQPGKVVPT